MDDKKYTADGLPIIPPLPLPPTRPADGAIAQCGECGIRIPSGAWGYVCSRTRCPIFPRVRY